MRVAGPIEADAMSIEVRPATESDAGLLLQFIHELAEYENLSGEVIATEASLRSHLFGPSPAAQALIGLRDGEPVGFALFFGNFSTFLGRPGIYLEDLFVRPQARGCGVGTALLREVARIAVQRNAGRLEWAVLDWNAPAIGYYQKLGADPMDQWTVYRVTGQALTDLSSEQSPT
jgi:GNAT superfamily N-acetyltransferase